MEKIIVDNRYRTVIYDSEEEVYKKTVRPKTKERLKMFLGMKRPQGKNADYISKLLKKNGIKTYEVLSYTKYSYITKEVKGKTLIEKILEIKEDKNKVNVYLTKYMEAIQKIIELDLCYTDFTFNNVMIDEKDEICLIDIDEMQDTWYCKIFKSKEIVPRLKKNLGRECSRLKGLNIESDAEKIIYDCINKIS